MRRNTIYAIIDKLCFLLSHAMLLRSETALSLQLPDFFSKEIEDQRNLQCVIVSERFYASS